MSFANNVDWGWDLPPGCSQKDIDDAFGDADEEEEAEEVEEDEGAEARLEEDKSIFHRESEEAWL